MNAIEQVKYIVDQLVRALPYLRCVYEYDEFDNTHYVQVVPATIFFQDETYLALESRFVRQFTSRFPHEFLAFQTEEEYAYEIQDPTYTRTGYLYDWYTQMEQYATNLRPLFEKYEITNLNEGDLSRSTTIHPVPQYSAPIKISTMISKDVVSYDINLPLSIDPMLSMDAIEFSFDSAGNKNARSFDAYEDIALSA